MIPRTLRALSLAMAAGTLAPATPAQSQLFEFDGTAPFDGLGAAVDGAGDVNADGFDDLIISATGADNNGLLNSGNVLVISGANGEIIHSINGAAAGDFFGLSVTGIGDYNGDTFDDFLVGAPAVDTNGQFSGAAYVISGFNAVILVTLLGGNGDRFGVSVDGGGDLNNDGRPDFIVGSWLAHQNGTAVGSATVYSGQSAFPLRTFFGPNLGAFTSGHWFGASVAFAGDVDNDGFDDVIVGAPNDGSNGGPYGFAVVYSGATGAELHRVDGTLSSQFTGNAVSAAGDVDADGNDDFMVGIPLATGGGQYNGRVEVRSGASGAVLYEVLGDIDNLQVGPSIARAGDVNDDGFDDFMVGRLAGSGATSPGRVDVISGATGLPLFILEGSAPTTQFGFAINPAGDVNCDGVPDLVVGAPGEDSPLVRAGRTRLYSGTNNVGLVYCAPAVNNSTGGPAVIGALGSADVAANDVLLTVHGLPPSTFGFFLAGRSPAFVMGPGGSQGNLCLGGPLGRYVGPGQIQNSGATGSFSLQIDLTAMPTPNGSVSALSGAAWVFQAWYRDANPFIGSNFTNGLLVVFE